MSQFAVVAGDFPITQGYGWTDFEGEPGGHDAAHWHEGVDIGCPDGTSCLAPVDGVVVVVAEGAVVLQTPSGARLYYFHIGEALVGRGQAVSAGQAVALSDTTAVLGGVTPTGPHLHFGVRLWPYRYQVDDVDPAAWLNPPTPPPPDPAPEPAPAPAGEITWANFSGVVAVPVANVRGGPGVESAVLYTVQAGAQLSFDGWCRHGDPIPDVEGTPTAGTLDDVWFHISPQSDAREGWIASAIVNGGPF